MPYSFSLPVDSLNSTIDSGRCIAQVSLTQADAIKIKKAADAATDLGAHCIKINIGEVTWPIADLRDEGIGIEADEVELGVNRLAIVRKNLCWEAHCGNETLETDPLDLTRIGELIEAEYSEAE